MSALQLRAAEAADASALAELVRAAYAHYVERIGRPPRPMTDDYDVVIRTLRVTVAERAGEIVGLIVLEVGERVTIDNVAVAPEHRATGVGRALLEHAEASARAAGHQAIYLYTHERMTENQSLYSRVGYVEYSRRQHGAARVVHMRKQLT
jgi:ribosomal protein S18 acetylase RimI-like enzyme